MKQPRSSPVLTGQTQELFAKLDKALGHPFVAYWTSSGGSICEDDVMVMSQLISQEQDRTRAGTLGIFLKSDGGSGQASLRLMHLLRNHYRRIILFAPFECASAATMFALGCDEIHMGPTSYLTAVDTSLRHDLSPVDHRNDLVYVSQDEVMRILRLWRMQRRGDNPYPELYKYLHPLVIGALDRSSSHSIRICRELLSYHMKNSRKAERISRQLNSGYPSHSYPITARETERLGLNVKKLSPQIETLLNNLNRLYSTMCQSIRTDHDQQNYHHREICNILERKGHQNYFQRDRDWHYRKEERRWVSLNDKSRWHQVVRQNRRWKDSIFFIR